MEKTLITVAMRIGPTITPISPLMVQKLIPRPNNWPEKRLMMAGATACSVADASPLMINKMAAIQ